MNNTLHKEKPHRQPSEKLAGYPKSTKKRLQRWRAALIGCLMILTAATSACASKSETLPDVPQITVDASLLVEPNLTKQLVDVLSE